MSDARRQAVPDENRAVARRALVPRPRQQFRPPLGPCAGHQATDAPGDLRAVDDVVPGGESPAIPLEGGGGRDAPHVPPPRHGIDSARTSRRLARRLGVLAEAHSRAGGAQASEGDSTMSACRDAAPLTLPSPPGGGEGTDLSPSPPPGGEGRVRGPTW